MASLKKSLSEFVSQSQDAKSSFNIGLSALKNGTYDTAIKKFEQVLEIDDSEDMRRQVYPNLGQAYMLNSQPSEAIMEFRNALRLNPDTDTRAFIHANMGYIYTQKQFYGFAIIEYQNAIRENENDVTSYLTLGMLYDNKFQYSEAKTAFEKVLEFNPEHPQAKEFLSRYESDELLPVIPKEPVVRVVKLIPTLGLIVAMSYDVTYDGFFPMVIYVYPESPLHNQIEPGDTILNVFVTNSQEIEANDSRHITELLETPPNTEISFQVGDEEIEAVGIEPITHPLDQKERIDVYRNWLQSFDSRLAWLWSAPQDVREEIGPLWGNELQSLVMELKTLKHSSVYHFAYALMIEHFQAFKITEGDEEKEIQYQINLGRFLFSEVTPDLINHFSEMQFQYVANLLASRI